MSSPSFVSFILLTATVGAGDSLLAESQDGPRFGFTTPRSLGKANIRNRIRRRMREAVRLERGQFAPQASIVFNPRRKALEVDFQSLRKEVSRVAAQCRQ